MDTAALTRRDYQQLAAIMQAEHGDMSIDSPVDLLVVFCCADPMVGRTAAGLHSDGLVRRVVFSGGVGKDSGGLPALGISEAVFQASVAIATGLPPEVALLEEAARNGAQNASHSLQLAAGLGLLPDGVRIASLAPAVRARRLYEELRYQAAIGYPSVEAVCGRSSGTVDLEDPLARKEMLRELHGLSTMHEPPAPRIHRLEEFHPGGAHYQLVEKAMLSRLHGRT